MQCFKRVASNFKRFASLEVNFAGFDLKNPVVPAPGPTVNDGQCMVDLVEAGVGAMVAKTVSLEKALVPSPCMITTGQKKKNILNYELHSDAPVEQWIEEWYPMITEGYPDIPFFTSLGYNDFQVRNVAPRLEAAGSQAIELSIHHQLTDEERDSGLTHSEATLNCMERTIEAILETTNLPVFAKLSPFVVDTKDFAIRAVEAGATGLVAINSIGPCLGINTETRQPVTGGHGGSGWLSGPAIKAVALQAVWDILQTVDDVPVIGVGGISSGIDAIEFIMAGATLVGVCTAGILEGPKAYSRIIKEMGKWMDENGVESLDEIRGCALQSVLQRKTPKGYYGFEEEATGAGVAYYKHYTPQVNKEHCVKCGKCFKICNIYKAISWKKGKYPEFDAEKCYGCGLCSSVCKNKGALEPPKYWEI